MSKKTTPKTTIISEAEYFEASENYYGFCLDCKDFTREMTEPDAENYDCPCCGKLNVVGAEQALILGYIAF